MVFNGNPPRPNNGTLINQDNRLSIKLKDPFQNNGVVKSKMMIQELLGFELNFNSYLNLKSITLQCPLHVESHLKSHKKFNFFLKSQKSSKQLRLALYPTLNSVSNTATYYSSKLNLNPASINLKTFDTIGREITFQKD